MIPSQVLLRMRHVFIIILCAACSFTTASGQSPLQSPDDFLGYDLGSRFTLHHQIADYTEFLALSIPHAKLVTYGRTYEGRPLQLLAISSVSNLQKLEIFRKQHLDRMNGGMGDPRFDDVALIWLSYNVHGNEAVCSEAALEVMHQLALLSLENNGQLDHVIVLIDPCLNPDGHDRYATWFNRYGSKIHNPDPQAFEHDEDWPGGRSNHYLFDLNRDWAWQKQSESQDRSQIYHAWMPHVHCDYHEMGYNSPYYFAPAAEPYHESITPWQRAFQDSVGRNTGSAFDARGELYYTKESFDLLYPSYGDTYPIFNGAVGMTYEQGGSGSAGVLIQTTNGPLLSLDDRIENHVESSMKAIETSASLSRRLVDEWAAFYNRNRTTPIGQFAGYWIPVTEQNEQRTNELVTFLDRHGIVSEQISESKKSVEAWEYGSGQWRTARPKKGDLVISSYQTHSGILNVLFDPNPVLTDSLTYDITTWSIPYAYGLTTYGLQSPIGGDPWTMPVVPSVADDGYGYAIRRNGLQDSKLMAALMQQGVRFRVNATPFQSGGRSFLPGTLLVLRADQEESSNWSTQVQAAAAELSIPLYSLPGGYSESGPDMGSDDVYFLPAPRVAALTGTGVSSLSAGEVWWHFEQELEYPITMLSTASSSPADWNDYDVVIMPSGWYGAIDADWKSDLKSWIRDGGRLIAINNALRMFKDEDGWALRGFTDEEKKNDVRERNNRERQEDRVTAYADRTKNRARGISDGSIYPIHLDTTHPLAWGYPDAPYYTLRSSGVRYALMNSGWNIGRFEDAPEATSGFVGTRANRDLEESLVFGVLPMGNGSVTYLADNPLFRGFWENGKLLFDNAVFLNGAR